MAAGVIFHGGNEGDSSWSLPRCPWNAPVEMYNFLIPLPRRKLLGAIALSKTKHAGLRQ